MKIDFNFDEINKKISKGVQNGLVEFGSIVGKESSAECPRDKGYLRSSLQVDTTPTSVFISYGDERGGKSPTEDYAYLMHEGINPKTGKKYNYKNGKKDKFLEDPFKRHIKDFETIIGKNIKI